MRMTFAVGEPREPDHRDCINQLIVICIHIRELRPATKTISDACSTVTQFESAEVRAPRSRNRLWVLLAASRAPASISS
jgi:hypothetical protein